LEKGFNRHNDWEKALLNQVQLNDGLKVEILQHLTMLKSRFGQSVASNHLVFLKSANESEQETN